MHAACGAPGSCSRPPSAWAGEQLLASWNQPLRGQLIAFAQAAADPASPRFVPPARRIASFDVDGTLIVERPLFFVLEVALARLGQICPDHGQQGPGPQAQCAAAAGRDRHYLMRHLNPVLSQPFAGMTQAAYRQLAARVWQRNKNPKLGLTLKRTAYEPMRELIALLRDKGFTVFLNSGSDSLALMAISSAWGLGDDACIGSDYELSPRQEGGKVVFSCAPGFCICATSTWASTRPWPCSGAPGAGPSWRRATRAETCGCCAWPVAAGPAWCW